MLPLLLLLLLSALPPATARETCNERAACLFFTTCYAESVVEVTNTTNATTMLPAVEATLVVQEAVNAKHACAGLGVISTLAMVPTSRTSLNISFETEFDGFKIAFGNLTEPLLLVRGSNDFNGTFDVEGAYEAMDKSKSSPIEALGRVTYSFRLESNGTNRSSLDLLIPKSVYFILGNQTFEFETSLFWRQIDSKRGCDPDRIHDSCHGTEDCEKVVFGTQSVSCEQPSQLSIKLNSSEWNAVSSVMCRAGHWIFPVINLGTQEEEKSDYIEVICRKPALNVTTTSPPEEGEDVAVVAQKADGSTTEASPVTVTAEMRKGEAAKNSLPGSKWIYIGGAVGLLLVIIIVNVVVCLLCCRNKNADTREQDKTVKKNNNSKKGSKQPEDSSTQQPSTSESKLPSTSESKAEESKPLIGNSSNLPPSAESVMNAPTEMNLDVLKTEFQ